MSKKKPISKADLNLSAAKSVNKAMAPKPKQAVPAPANPAPAAKPPNVLRHLMRCGKCGCLVEHKAKWKTTTCPDGKWKEQDLSDLPKPNPNPDGEKQG